MGTNPTMDFTWNCVRWSDEAKIILKLGLARNTRDMYLHSKICRRIYDAVVFFLSRKALETLWNDGKKKDISNQNLRLSQ